MLSSGELAVIDALARNNSASLQEIASATDYSQDYLYGVLDDLIDKGLLTESRNGHNQRHPRLTQADVVEVYRRLILQHDHVDWVDLLAPATIRVLWHLDEPRRLATVAARLDISRQAVHDALSPLKGRALLRRLNHEYAFADELEPLRDFVHAVVMHDHRVRVRRTAPTAVILWCDPRYALVQAHTSEDTESLQNSDQWEVTGVAGFRKYGLKFLLPREPLFWYAPGETLTAAEMICHTVITQRDSQRVSYAMLLIEQQGIEEERLTETAARYGIAPTISQLYEFLEGGFKSTEDVKISLPSAQEYTALKDQYGVE